MKKYAFVFVIFLFALFIRFFQLTLIPPALNSDEVAIGYNSYSIATTGKDEFGKTFPLTFRSFDDYKIPVYVYMVAGIVKLGGLSDGAVRAPSAFFGALTVLFVYFLVLELTREKKELQEKGHTIGIVASFLLAISPWHIMFSRSGYEANVSVFFIVAGLLAFFVSFRKPKALLLSAIAFALSIWTYHSARVYVPLVLLLLGVLYMKTLWKQKGILLGAIVVGGILLFPLIKMTFSLEGQMRAMGVSAFANPEMLKKSIDWTMQDRFFGQHVFSFFHNRRFDYIQVFLHGYLSHFDFQFLFLDKAMERFRAPGVGMMYLFELPFLLFGLHTVLNWKTKSGALLIVSLLFAPVAAAFTLQLPHPVRTIVFLPTLQIITGIGIVELFDYIRIKRTGIGKHALNLFGAVVFFVSLSMIMYFFHQYFFHLPKDNASMWYSGRKEMVERLKTYEASYDRIIISNTLGFPYIFFLYYYPIEPKAYLKSGGTISGGFKEEENHFGKYEFRTLSKDMKTTKEKRLFVGTPDEVFSRRDIVETILYPNYTKAIVLFE